MRPAAILIVLLAAAGCGAGAPPVAAPAAVELAPRPFTADQLRAAMPVGHTFRWRESKPEGVAELTWRVTAADASGCTIASERTPEGGAAVAEPPETSTWQALANHASFPAAATRIDDSSIDVGAGHFTTRRYVVTADGVTREMHFAPDLPGPPVLMKVSQAGREVFRLELLERR